ncbi:MAG: Site-specific recombinase XerD [Rhodobacteraceae bacterium HLUCCA12]|nr:MAG: Site-specific recombinase XerD [Rhodobacteraceae bacterium HLUCCA12]
MVKRKKYLWQHPDGRWYVRIKGKYHRINADEGTPGFDREYWDILTGRRAEAKRSFSALIKLIRESDWWRDKSPRYRADLEPVFQYLEEKVGKRDVSRMTQADIYEAMDRNAHRIRFANYIPTALSRLFKLAVRKRWRNDNPAIGIEPLPMPKAKKRPHIPWTDAAVAKMRSEGTGLALLVFELGVGTVQRPGDLPGFTWGDYDGDTLFLRQGKTDKPLHLPCTAALKAALAKARNELGAAPHPSRHILTLQSGQRMTYRRMAEIFLTERKRLGLEAFDLHALRYRGVMELAWHGCDDDEIQAYSGHNTKAMVIKYAGEARQIMRARQAREKRK